MSVKPQPFMERFERLRLTREEKVAALGENDWPHILGIDHEELVPLADYLTPYRGERGALIFRKEDEESFMCLINSGSVQIFSAERDVAGEPLGTLEKGSTVGEMALIDGEPRSAYAYAAADALLFVMTRGNFLTLQQEHPPLWGKLLLQIARQMSARLRQTSDNLGRHLQLKWRRILKG